MSRVRCTSIRFDIDDPIGMKAWEYLHTMDKKKFKSFSHAVSVALADYFDRYYDEKNKTSEKQDLANLIADEVIERFKKILPEYTEGFNARIVSDAAEETADGNANIDWDFIGAG